MPNKFMFPVLFYYARGSPHSRLAAIFEILSAKPTALERSKSNITSVYPIYNDILTSLQELRSIMSRDQYKNYHLNEHSETYSEAMLRGSPSSITVKLL